MRRWYRRHKRASELKRRLAELSDEREQITADYFAAVRAREDSHDVEENDRIYQEYQTALLQNYRMVADLRRSLGKDVS